MKFVIAPDILEKFAGLSIGVVVGKNINNVGENPAISSLLRDAEKQVKETFKSFEFPQQHPGISAWRKIYKEFGSDPKDFRCSSEALVRRVLKGELIRHINKLVDLYNYVSLKYVLPVGGEDTDSIEGDLILDFAKGDEPFIRLGGEENEPPDSGEVVYKDNQGIICRRWNWREGERTKLTEQTKNCILVIEGVPPATKDEVESTTIQLKEIVEKYCGGTVTSFILNTERPELVI